MALAMAIAIDEDFFYLILRFFILGLLRFYKSSSTSAIADNITKQVHKITNIIPTTVKNGNKDGKNNCMMFLYRILPTIQPDPKAINTAINIS